MRTLVLWTGDLFLLIAILTAAAIVALTLCAMQGR